MSQNSGISVESHNVGEYTPPGVPEFCWRCVEKASLRVSRSERNPNRRYFRCDLAHEQRIMWLDDALLQDVKILKQKNAELEKDISDLFIYLSEFAVSKNEEKKEVKKLKVMLYAVVGSSLSRSEPIFGRSTVEPEELEEIQNEENSAEQEEEEESSCNSFTATPPKNAFLLTLCRSAPYKSPSFANNSFLEDQKQANEAKEDPFQQHASQEHALVSVKSTERLDDSRRESAATEEEPKRSVLESPLVQCVVLTRCKSEPARVREKLVPELSYRQNRRLGFT